MAELSDFVEFDKLYELNIGQTFLSGSQPTYHNFKCKQIKLKLNKTNFEIISIDCKCAYTLFMNRIDDFTPASIDKNQEAKVMIGERNDVVIQVPHVDVM